MPQIEQIPIELALPIRHRAMYPGQDQSFAKLPDDEEGIHFGLFDENKLISVVSWFRRNEEAAQFRKMATLEEYRNSGYGTLLLRYIIDFSEFENIGTLWCNARVSAASFYERLGFKETGEHFTRNEISYVTMTLCLSKV